MHCLTQYDQGKFFIYSWCEYGLHECDKYNENPKNCQSSASRSEEK